MVMCSLKVVEVEVVFIPTIGGVSKPHSKDITPTHIHTLTSNMLK